MTSSTVVIILSVICCTLIAIGNAAPTTYDERQDGDWNVRAKLENIMIVVALPSKTVTDHMANSQVTSYLSMIAAAHALQPEPPHYDGSADTTNTDTTEPSKADDELDQSQYDKDAEDLFGLFTDADDDSKKLKNQPLKSSENIETGVESASGVRPKGRNLWGQVEDVVHNRQGASLKKELSWGQDEDAVLPAEGLDEHSRSNDHNEVGLIANSHLTLIGGSTEDCGPDRVRNSYGICQALPSK